MIQILSTNPGNFLQNQLIKLTNTHTHVHTELGSNIDNTSKADTDIGLDSIDVTTTKLQKPKFLCVCDHLKYITVASIRVLIVYVMLIERW